MLSIQTVQVILIWSDFLGVLFVVWFYCFAFIRASWSKQAISSPGAGSARSGASAQGLRAVRLLSEIVLRGNNNQPFPRPPPSIFFLSLFVSLLLWEYHYVSMAVLEFVKLPRLTLNWPRSSCLCFLNSVLKACTTMPSFLPSVSTWGYDRSIISEY